MFTTLISTADLAARLGAPDLAIVDVRHDLAQPDAWGEEQYAAGHVPGRALRAPRPRPFGAEDRPQRPPSAADAGACAAVFGRLGIGAGTQVVGYDQQQGMYASRLWWMLRWLGHDAVAVLDGGWAEWIARRPRRSTTAVPARAGATFAPRRVGRGRSRRRRGAGEPAGAVAVAARRAGPERFRGETEPLDPVAGHIPGAPTGRSPQNLDRRRHVQAGRRRCAPSSRRWSATRRSRRGRPPVRVGRHRLPQPAGDGNRRAAGTRLYPGSWSEWVADPLARSRREDERQLTAEVPIPGGPVDLTKTSPVQHVELPEVLVAHVQHRLHARAARSSRCSSRGSASRRTSSRVASSTRHVEAALAHHQHALGAQRELGVQAQVAEQVGDHRAVELSFIVCRYRPTGESDRRPELISSSISVSASKPGRASRRPPSRCAGTPGTAAAAARARIASVASARRRQQVVVRRVQHDREREARAAARAARACPRARAARGPSPRRSPWRRRA